MPNARNVRRILSAAATLALTPAQGATLYWDGSTVTANGASGGGAGSWSSGGSGWEDGATAVTWTNGDTAVFGGTAGTVTLGGALTANGLTFDTAGYTIAGSTLTLGGATPTITANQNVTLTSIVAGSSGFTKAGAGTLTLSARNAYTGPVVIDAGTLAIGIGTLGSVSNSHIATGASTTLLATAAQTISELKASNFASVVIQGSWQPTATAATVQADTFSNNGTTITFWAAFWDGGSYTKAVKIEVTKSGSDFRVRQTDARYIQANIMGSPTFATQIANGSQPPIGSGGYGVYGVAMVDAGDLGVSDMTLNGTSTLALGSSAQEIGSLSGVAGTTVSGDGALTIGSTGSSGSYAGVISGAQVLTKTGAGTQTLSGVNTYTGATTVSAGTLRLGSATALGGTSVGTSVASGATLDLNGQAVGAEALFLAGSGVSSAGALVSSTGNASLSGAVTLTANTAVGGAGNLTLSGAIGGAYSLTKVGNGTLTLSVSNSYSGGTVISQGGITLGNAGSLGSGSVTLGDASTGSANLALLIGGSFTFARAVNVAANGTGTVTLGATGAFANPEFSGAITLNRDVVLAGGSNTDRMTFTGGISGTGNVTITGPGRVMFLNATNSFTGGLTIASGGLLQLHWGGATSTVDYIPDASVLTVNGMLKIAKGNNGSETVGGLAGSGEVRSHEGVASVASVLVVNNAGNHTFSGVLSNGGASGATLSLVKKGAGAQTLSGANTHTGGTTVENGVLALVGANNRLATGSSVVLGATGTTGKLVLGDASGAISQTLAGLTAAGSGGSVVGGNASTSTLTLAIASGNNAFTGTFGGAGANENKVALTKTGAGTLTLSGGGTVSHLQPDAGTLAITGGALTVANQFSLSNWGTAQTATVNQSGGTVTLGAGAFYYGARSNNQAITYNLSGGTFDATSGNFHIVWDGGSNNPVFTVSGTGLLKVAGLRRGNSVNGAYAGTNAGTLELTGGRIVIGSDGISNSGGSSANAADLVYTTLRFGGGTIASSAAFSGSAGQGIILTGTNGGTTFDTTDGTITLNGALSGAGSLIKAGTGLLVLGATNTYAGGTTISDGTLRIGALGALGTGSVTVSGGVLDLNNLAPTNVIVLSGGSLLNESAWAASGSLQVTGSVDSSFLNSLPTAEIKVAAGATVNLTGVTKDIVFEGGSLSNLSGFSGKLKVKGSLDLSSVDPQGQIEVAAGGTVDFGSRASSKAVKFTGGTVTGANFTGDVEVVGSGVALGSGIQAGRVRLTSGNSATIQSGFGRDIAFAGGSLSGLANYSGTVSLETGATLSVGDTTTADFSLASGSVLKGSGSVGTITQATGSTLAPGNSPGTLTAETLVLAGGAEMEVEFFDPAGAAGTGYDNAVVGSLDLSGLSSANRYTLRLVSLSALPSTPGALAGFDPTQSFAFQIFDYTNITMPNGYTVENIAQLFTLDISGFDDQSGAPVTSGFTLANNLATGAVDLVYAPIPEPSTYGLVLGALALAGAAVRRRRKA